jgi:hypothetical protein
MRRIPLPYRSRSDQSFNVQFTRVDKQSDEGLLIIRFIPDIAQDNRARMPAKSVNCLKVGMSLLRE